jgi:hypothetical protein
MRRIRVAGLCTTLLLALGAGSAQSSYAALPEFSGPFGKPFTSTSGPTRLRGVGGKRVICAASTDAGEITGAKTGSVVITWTGCTFKKTQCSTPGSAPGEIVSPSLTMNVGYINKSAKTVGIDLVEPPGGPFLLFSCLSGTRVLVVGSVIGKIMPVNKLVTPSETFKVRFAQLGGIQKIQNLEGEPKDTLEVSFLAPLETAGLRMEDQMLFAEPVTLSA